MSRTSTVDGYFLIGAINSNNFREVQLLIERGAKIDYNSGAPLIYAVRLENFKIVKYLVENGANVHVQEEHPFGMAVLYHYFEIADFLLDHGANFRANHDRLLRTAVLSKNLQAIKYLRKVYSEIYKERFLCHECLVLAICQKLCSKRILR
jgi:ankyrin repeat protein